MTDSRWEQLKELINEAMDLPREEWGSFLAERCDDPDLRDEALRHLSEVSQLGSFLQHAERADARELDLDRTRAVDPAATRDVGPGATRESPPPADSGTLGSTVDFVEGTREVERADDASRPTYELLEILGQGGFGVVYKANQLTPVRRPVAIKYLRPEKENAANDLRFEAERQALASLSHPGIAKLLDAGRAPDGRQYFSMEFVEGIPLDKFCDQKQLGIRPRLELFIQVCEAIQHAHFRGIIHRDLKPANVLAFEQDGIPGIRVIDLGLAMATEEPLTEGGRFVREGPGAGTPTFMSPEQWSHLPDEIDTRTDVYALGVILYHALTGLLPIGFDREMSLREFGTMLTETVPALPNARLRALPAEERAQVAKLRGVDEHRLLREIDSDLDHIAKKALAKDPDDRYESAGALAADLRRVFAHETIDVHPPSLGYQVRKFVRRNRPAVVGASLILLTAVIGLSTTSAFWAVAQEERELSQLLEDEETVSGASTKLESMWPLGPEVITPLEELQEDLIDVASRRTEYEAKKLAFEAELETVTGETRELIEFRAELLRSMLDTIDLYEADDGRKGYSDLEDLARLVTLVKEGELERLPERGLLTEIDWRLEKARTLDEFTRSGSEARTRWANAREEIAAASRYSGMAPMEPQLGLLPIGMNEESGLFEFWHVLSGTSPERGSDGRIRMRPENGIVLVLIPGGSYEFGCQNPLGVSTAEFEGRVTATHVVHSSAADLAGVRQDDQILSVDDTAISSKNALNEVQASLVNGGEINMRVLQAESGEEIEVRLTIPPPGPGRIYDLYASHIEGPTQTIDLDPYFTSKFEVTQSQWARWTGVNPSTCAVGGRIKQRYHTADQPVETVSWAEAREVCVQMGLRIPSEAQWEAACRAGERAPWYIGDKYREIDGHVNITDRQVALHSIGWSGIVTWLDDGYALSAPVGSYEPNANGLHDMMGNVWEWCFETGVKYSAENFEMRPGDGRRPEKSNTSKRAMRGGSYENGVLHIRSAYRWNFDAGGSNDVGFRPVRPLDGAP